MKSDFTGLNRRQALVALAAAGVTARGQAQAGSVLPLRRLHTGDVGILVATRLTMGPSAGWWLLDSGATSHLVDPAQAANLATESRATVALAGGASEVRRVLLAPLQAEGGAAALTGQRALVVDLAPLREATGEDIHGVLGMPLLAARRASFDLDRLELRLTESGDAADSPPPGAIDVALRLDAGLPTLEASIAEGRRGRFLLDTGFAGAAVLFAGTAEKLARERALPQLTLRELGGSVSARYARLSQLALGAYTRRDVPLALEVGGAARRGGHFERLDGAIGLALFDGGVLTLDLPRRRLRVQHPRAASALPGGFGFLPRQADGALVIASVFDASPAAEAGWRPGDRWVTLDAAEAPRTPADAWRRLYGRDEARFGLERDGATIHTTLRRASFFPPLF